jgi:DNA modification methylase
MADKYTIVKCKLSELVKPPYNPRTIDKEEYAGLKESLKTFGYVDLLVVNKRNNHIVGGNQRSEALKELGYTEIDVIEVDLDDKQERKLNVVLNSQAISGKYDDLKLSEILEELKLDDDYESLRLDKLEPLDLSDVEVEEDEAPDVSSEPPVSKLGEVYQLGRHRVMCGDSTNERLGDQMFNYGDVQLILTDPPYNLGFDYNEYDDNKSVEKYSKMLSDSISRYRVNKVVTTGKQNLKLWYEIETIEDVAIWYSKNKMSGGKISNLSLWEPIVFIGKFDRSTRPNDVLEYTNENQKDTGDHTCPKTVKLFSELLKYSKKGDGIFDPYLGSGTTLIACEQTDRTCYGMELDPKYVDVIRKRYWKFTHDGNEEGWEDGTTNSND